MRQLPSNSYKERFLIFAKLSNLFALVRGKGYALILLYILVIGSTAMESIGIALFYPITKMLADAEEMKHYQEKLVSSVPAFEVLSQDQFLFYSLLIFAVIFVVKNAFLMLASYGNIRVITNLYCSWVNQIFAIYLNKPYSYFTENKVGDLVQRKILQTHKAASSLRLFVQLLGGLTNIFGVFIVLCFMHFKVMIAISILMIPVYYITLKASREKFYKAGDRIVELEKKGFGLATEILSGIKQVKNFCAENHFQNQIRKIWIEHSGHLIQNQFLVTLARPVLETLLVIAVVGACMMLGNVAGQGKELFPMLAVFGVGMYRILPLAAACSSQFMALSAVLPSVETVVELLKKEETVKERGAKLLPMSNSIEFRDVSFSYSGRKDVLKSLSLTFKNNKFYGIVGVSGSGKSTLIDLLAGFIKPKAGKILIDGVDICKIDISTWLCQIGLISQDAFIFSGTIEDNICFGIEPENRNQDRIIEAAQTAYANEFINLLPEGYQTIVGEKGVKLSGGQRQRLAIARAIYLDPPILIFDEATSSLDAHSERMVQKAIEKLHGKRTVIVVAHRLVTVALADYIFVIEDGNLVEEGNHEELRAGSGLYSSLCSKQRFY